MEKNLRKNYIKTLILKLCQENIYLKEKNNPGNEFVRVSLVHSNNKSKEAINKIARQLKCSQKIKKMNLRIAFYKLLICFLFNRSSCCNYISIYL